MSTPSAPNLPQLPVIDEALCVEAARLATGARIHSVMGDIGTYKGSVSGAHRLAEMIASGRCGPARPGEPTLEQDLAARIAAGVKYEAKLRGFVSKQRQISAGILPAS